MRIIIVVAAIVFGGKVAAQLTEKLDAQAAIDKLSQPCSKPKCICKAR